MKRDLFLESLQAQATGNHQRNSTMGRPLKSPQQKLHEINLGGSMGDDEYLQGDIDDLGHTSLDQQSTVPRLKGGFDQSDTDQDYIDGMLDAGYSARDIAGLDDTDSPPNLAALQQAAHSHGSMGGEEKPLLQHLRRAKMRADGGIGEEERVPNNERKPSSGGSPHLRQEMEQIQSQLTGLLHRLKGVMAQL